MLGQTTKSMWWARNSLPMACPSVRVEGRISTRASFGRGVGPAEVSESMVPILEQRAGGPAQVRGHPGQHALEIGQRFANDDTVLVELQLADGLLVVAISLLYHG